MSVHHVDWNMLSDGDNVESDCDGDELFAGTMGTEVGQYVLRKTLGPGGRGIGSVWYADTDGPAKVCLKIARHGARYESTWRVELACLRATASYGGIVNLVDHFMFTDPKTAQVHPCHALEWVGGGDLFDLIKYHPDTLTVSRCLGIICEITEAVAYLHAGMADGWRVVHNDIKPENILVGTDGSMRLTDFGSVSILHGHDADALGTKTQWIQKYGQTTEYRSVEIICGPTVTPAADVWATACVFFELLTHGECLFDPGSASGSGSQGSHGRSGGSGSGSRGSHGSYATSSYTSEDEADDEVEDTHQLLVIRECLGTFPRALAREYPGIFNRKGDLRPDRLRDSGIPEDLVDAKAASVPVCNRLCRAGVRPTPGLTGLFTGMLRMNHTQRTTATDALVTIRALIVASGEAVQ